MNPQVIMKKLYFTIVNKLQSLIVNQTVLLFDIYKIIYNYYRRRLRSLAPVV
jgi:hypothetical protein